MFVGHYAPALLIRRIAPRVPLWKLFLACQGTDLLFWSLVPLGIERMQVDPSREGFLQLQLEWMPWSHSLLATLCWAGLTAAVFWRKGGRWLGLAVASHWLMDLFVHAHDLPLAAGDGIRVGLGLWDHPLLSNGLEVGLLLGAAALVGRRALWLAAGLSVAQLLQAFVLPFPTQIPLLAAMSLGSYLGIAWLAARMVPDEAGPAATEHRMDRH